MRLARILIVLAIVTTVALYVVSVQKSKEGFEESTAESQKASDSKVGETVKLPAVSGAAMAGESTQKTADEIDALVFKAYMDVFGVPPTPTHSQHYASIVKSETLDSAKLTARMQRDAGETLKLLSAGENPMADDDKRPYCERFPDKCKPVASQADMDADMRALRAKAEGLSATTGPVAPPATVSGSTMDTVKSKLRNIAGEVSNLAKQFDVPLPGKKEPAGVESFINLCR